MIIESLENVNVGDVIKINNINYIVVSKTVCDDFYYSFITILKESDVFGDNCSEERKLVPLYGLDNSNYIYSYQLEDEDIYMEEQGKYSNKIYPFVLFTDINFQVQPEKKKVTRKKKVGTNNGKE